MSQQSPVTYTDAGTYDSLVAKVRRLSYIPAAQESWTDQDIIATLDDKNKNYLIPKTNNLTEEYFVSNFDYNIPTTGWSGIIDIPSDAIGLDLRDVWASAGQGTTGDSTNVNWAPCRRCNPNQFNYPTTTFNWLGSVGPPYYVENNKIIFFIANSLNISTGFTQIKMRYFKKPNTLVSRKICAQVIAVDTTLNTITLDNSNSNKAFSSGQTFDFIRNVQPFVFTAAAVTPTVVVVQPTFTTFSVDADTAAAIQVSDLCCPVGTAPVLQYMPEESNLLLCQSVVVQMQDSQGNSTAYDRAVKQMTLYEADYVRLLTPKVADQMKVMVSQSDLFSTNASFTGSGNYAGGVGSR